MMMDEVTDFMNLSITISIETGNSRKQRNSAQFGTTQHTATEQCGRDEHPRGRVRETECADASSSTPSADARWSHAQREKASGAPSLPHIAATKMVHPSRDKGSLSPRAATILDSVKRASSTITEKARQAYLDKAWVRVGVDIALLGVLAGVFAGLCMTGPVGMAIAGVLASFCICLWVAHRVPQKIDTKQLVPHLSAQTLADVQNPA